MKSLFGTRKVVEAKTYAYGVAKGGKILFDVFGKDEIGLRLVLDIEDVQEMLNEFHADERKAGKWV